MITSTILTILLGFVYLLDILLGSILPLQKGTAMFGYILSLMDNIVFYVRSILPLTISTIFFYAFIAFATLLLIKGVSMVKSIIPYFNRFGSSSGDIPSGGRTLRGGIKYKVVRKG